MSKPVVFHVYPYQALKILLLCVGALAVLSLIGDFFWFFLGHGRVLGFRPAFNLATENNIPTFFVSLLLLTSSLLSAIISRFEEESVARYRWHWMGLTGIFLYLSFDEMATIHERAMGPLRAYFDAGGIFYFAWVIPAMGLLAVFAIVYIRFWIHLPRGPRFFTALAGTTYVCGALGVELIGGYIYEASGSTFTYAIVTTAEETLEMAGVAFFIYSLLLFIRQHTSSISAKVVGA